MEMRKESGKDGATILSMKDRMKVQLPRDKGTVF